MVVAGGVGEADGQFHDIEKRRVGQGEASCAEVVGDMEEQEILARDEAFAFQQGGVAAAVGVGARLTQEGARGPVAEMHKHSGGGNAICGVQNVSG